jgi:hypothetical protein
MMSALVIDWTCCRESSALKSTQISCHASTVRYIRKRYMAFTVNLWVSLLAAAFFRRSISVTTMVGGALWCLGCGGARFSASQVDMLTITPARGLGHRFELVREVSPHGNAPIEVELTALPHSPTTYRLSSPAQGAIPFHYVTVLRECDHTEGNLSEGAIRRLFSGITLTSAEYSSLAPTPLNPTEVKVASVQGSFEGTTLSLCSFSTLEKECITDVVTWSESTAAPLCKEGIGVRLALTLLPLARQKEEEVEKGGTSS